jgi:membrane protein
MQDLSPLTPEARRRKHWQRRLDRLKPGARTIEVGKRVLVGVYNDGFIHAGNLAYMALLTIFPFFIVAAAVAHFFGRTGDGLHAVAAFLHTVPPNVASVLKKPIADVLEARSGILLWLGGLVGLWTTTSFIETIRDILRRAYGTSYSRPFWEYRLISIAITIVSVLAAMLTFTLQVLFASFEQLILSFFPFAENVAGWLGLSRLAQAVVLFPALYGLFYSLTPARYRNSECPKWPGALLVTIWWMATTAVLPKVLGMLGGYSLTYGGLAGVIIVLLFFFIVGLGLVVGAELNAALAETPEGDLKEETQIQEP